MSRPGCASHICSCCCQNIIVMQAATASSCLFRLQPGPCWLGATARRTTSVCAPPQAAARRWRMPCPSCRRWPGSAARCCVMHLLVCCQGASWADPEPPKLMCHCPSLGAPHWAPSLLWSVPSPRGFMPRSGSLISDGLKGLSAVHEVGQDFWGSSTHDLCRCRHQERGPRALLVLPTQDLAQQVSLHRAVQN